MGADELEGLILDGSVTKASHFEADNYYQVYARVRPYGQLSTFTQNVKSIKTIEAMDLRRLSFNSLFSSKVNHEW